MSFLFICQNTALNYSWNMLATRTSFNQCSNIMKTRSRVFFLVSWFFFCSFEPIDCLEIIYSGKSEVWCLFWKQRWQLVRSSVSSIGFTQHSRGILKRCRWRPVCSDRFRVEFGWYSWCSLDHYISDVSGNQDRISWAEISNDKQFWKAFSCPSCSSDLWQKGNQWSF